MSKSDEKFLRVSSLRGSSKGLAQDLAASSLCQVDPSTVRRSLIRNGLYGRVAAKKQLEGEQDIKVNMLKLTKIGIKITGKVYDGLTSLKFLGPITVNMCEGKLERDGGINACGLQ